MGIEHKIGIISYTKLYPKYFDNIHVYPKDFKVPEFINFFAEDNMTTWEHISQCIARLGFYGPAVLPKLILCWI